MVVAGAIELGLDGDAHRRHRCAQLVGDVRRERPLALEQLADALVGARQRAAERVELLDARVRRRHAFGLAERPGPVAEVLDRTAQAPREQDAGERRRGDDGDGGEGEHAEIALHPVVALAGRFRDAYDELGAVVADADRQGSHQVAVDDAFVDDAGERLGDDRVGGRRAAAVDQHSGVVVQREVVDAVARQLGEIDRSDRRHPAGDDRRLALQGQQLTALDVVADAGGGRHEEREHRQRGDGDDRRQDALPHASLPGSGCMPSRR